MLNGNRRSFFIFLTEKGKRQLKLVTQAFTEIEEKAFQGIPEADREKFMDMFSRIYENTMS